MRERVAEPHEMRDEALVARFRAGSSERAARHRAGGGRTLFDVGALGVQPMARPKSMSAPGDDRGLTREIARLDRGLAEMRASIEIGLFRATVIAGVGSALSIVTVILARVL